MTVHPAAHRGRLTGWRAGLVWAVVAVDLAAGSAGCVGVLLSADTPAWVVVLFMVMLSSFGMVGALVVTRQPRNLVGWILWATALLLALMMVGSLAARYLATSPPGTAPWLVLVAWLGNILLLPTIGLVVVFVPLLFPDGRLLSPRWRWVIALSAVTIVVATFPNMFSPDALPIAPTISNPFGITGFEQLRPLLDAANVLFATIVLPLAIVALVIRYRRGTSVERQQLKWFAAAVSLTGICFGSVVTQFGPLADLGFVLGLFGLATLPIAIGIAILRYRLYDIDRIISRTIGYLIVTGVLAAIFVGAVFVFTAVTSPLFGDNPVAVAASTLIVAALFQPLRRRVQRAVDRRFDRARYNADRTAATFSERLRDEVDMATITGDLELTTQGALAPASIGIWIRAGER